MWFFDPTLLLFLLLPVAAFSGWVIGRRHDSTNEKHSRIDIPETYLRGLNYFVNEQPDKAIDQFIQTLEVNKETVETHLALGGLFRRRGEVDRAIRIHQHLLTRPLLNPDARAQVMFELGQDYMKSGLLDRAEEVFQELQHLYPKKGLGILQLIDIYQQEQEWQKAIDAALLLPGKKDKAHQALIAQFYCELAQNQIRQDNFVDANKQLNKALDHDKNCVRASLLQGEVLEHDKKYAQALEVLQRIEKQDIQYISEAITPIVRCYRELNQLDAMKNYLYKLLQRQPSVILMLALTEQLQQVDGEVIAMELLEKQLQSLPSIKGVKKLIELELTLVNSEVATKLQSLRAVLETLQKNQQTYKCHHCGFGSRIVYWQCPSCRNWGTIKPEQ